MKSFRLLMLGVVAFGLMGLVACGPEEDNDNSPTPSPTTAAISFQNDIVPIFEGSCGSGLTGCHDAEPYHAQAAFGCRGWLSLADMPLGSIYPSGQNAGQPTGCADYDLYERLVDIGAWTCSPTPNDPNAGGGVIKQFIVPGDVANSYLFQRMTGQVTPCEFGPAEEFPYMPPIGTMPQEEIDTLRQWIEQGAPNN